MSKVRWDDCKDGISYTFSITPNTLGKTRDAQADTLADLMTGYFSLGAHYLNVNVLNREMLLDVKHSDPEMFKRISGVDQS